MQEDKQPVPEKEFTFKAILSLVSGLIVMLVVGSLYTFGTFTVYISSFLRLHGSPDLTTVDVGLIFPFILIAMNGGLILGSQLAKRIDARIIILGAFVLYGGGLMLLSFLESFPAYVGIYGIANGFFLGLPYILPINNACQYLPKRKGLVSGICIMGLGFGALLFNQIIVAVMNPDNISASSEHYFPAEVADNLPKCWRVLAGVYLGLAVLGTSIMIPKKKVVKEDEEKQSLLSEESISKVASDECEDLRDAFCRWNFYMLLTLIALSSSFGMFIAFNYKEYGMLSIQDDQFLTLAGSLGGIANGLSRIFWGVLLDYFTFKTLMIVVNFGLLAIALSIQYLAEQKVFFVVYVILTYFLYGGLFSLMPAKTYQLYGQKNGARVYSFAFFGFSIGSTLQFLLHYFLVGSLKEQGWDISFYILAGFQVLAVILSFFANKLEVNWKEINQRKQSEKLY